MFRRFDRHVMRQVLRSSGLCLAFLLLVDFVVQFSGDLDESHPLPLLLRSLLWQIPEKILLFWPAALLVGAILGLGQLAQSQELTAMQAAGVARWRILQPALLLALLLSGAMLLILEALSPRIQREHNQINQHLGREKQGDIWLRTSREWARVEALQADGSLGGVHLFRLEGEQWHYIYAPRAVARAEGWLLEQAQHQRLRMAEREQWQEDWLWPQPISAAQWRQLRRDSPFSSLAELGQNIDFLRKNGIEPRAEALRWWQRLLLPLTAMTMMMLAAPLVFGAQRSTAQGTRLLLGMLLGVAYYLLQTMLANLALLLQWSPALSAFLPNVLAWFFLMLLQRRIRGV